MQQNSALTVRVAELEELEASLRSQIAHERCAREQAQDQAQESLAAQRRLEITCEEAASEICELQSEVKHVKIVMHHRDNPNSGMQSASHDTTCLLANQVQQSQTFHQQTMVRILNMLGPERTAPLYQSVTQSGQSSTGLHALQDTGTYHALKVKVTAALAHDANDTNAIISWLDFLIEHGLRALHEAQHAHADAVLQAAEAKAEMQRFALMNLTETQSTHDTTLGLQADLKERNIELKDARNRLNQAATSAQKLAVTLAEQESTISRLQQAVSNATTQDSGTLHELPQPDVSQLKHLPKLKKVEQCCQTVHELHPAVGTTANNGRSFHIDLAQCRAQLESRNCRIRELREALTKGAGHDTDSVTGFMEGLTCHPPKHAVCPATDQLKAVQGDAVRWQMECSDLTQQIAALSDELHNDVDMAHVTLQKLQEPAAKMNESNFHRCQLNAKAAVADLLLHIDADRDARDMTKAVKDAIRALAAALELEHQRAVRLEETHKALKHSVQSLKSALCRAQSALSEDSMTSQDKLTSDQSNLETTAEQIASMLPVADNIVEEATALHIKLCHCSCSLANTGQHVSQLVAQLQRSEDNRAEMQTTHMLQIHHFQRTLQNLKTESAAAAASADEKSETELASLQKALMVAQEQIVTQNEEVAECQASFKTCNNELEGVRSELEHSKENQAASQALVCTLTMELDATRLKVQELQSQLEKARAATARAKFGMIQKEGQGRADANALKPRDASAVSQNSLETDVSALLHQLDVAHKRNIKSAKEKGEMDLQREQLQSRLERLEAVHAKVCERRIGAESSVKRLGAQVAEMQAKLQQVEKTKAKQQKQLTQMASQLSHELTAVERVSREKEDLLSQLSNAETIAQDVRCALSKKQAHCDELAHALAHARSQVEHFREGKCPATDGASKTCSKRDAVQQALEPCEADHDAVRQHRMEHNQERWTASEAAPLHQSTCVNLPPPSPELRLADSEDGKSIRIQQLRETLVSISSEKADLAEAVAAYERKIAEMEACAVLQRPCQVDTASSPCWEMQSSSDLEHCRSICCQTHLHPIAPLQSCKSTGCQCQLPSVESRTCSSQHEHDFQPAQQGLGVYGSPCRPDPFSGTVNEGYTKACTAGSMNESLYKNLQVLDQQKQGNCEGVNMVKNQTNRCFDDHKCNCPMKDCTGANHLIRSLQSTCEKLFQELQHVKAQTAAEIHALQQQLKSSQHAEETERAHKARLQGHVNAATAEGAQRRHELAGKDAHVLQIQSEFTLLQLERQEDFAKLDALSSSLSDARLEMQNIILRAAAKEDDLEKAKNMLSIAEADLSVYKRRSQAVEANNNHLHDRMVAVSEETSALKERNQVLESEVQALKSKQKACEALESQLRADVAGEQQRGDVLERSWKSTTALLERKTADLARCTHWSKMAQERLQNQDVMLQDARLQICNLQKERARARDQSASDFKALVDARKEVVALKKKLSELDEKLRKQAPRAKGNTLADVYKGGTMRRENGAATEEAAAQATESIESRFQATTAYNQTKDAGTPQNALDARDAEIVALKQQLAGLTEELAMASVSELFLPSCQSPGESDNLADRIESHSPTRPCLQDSETGVSSPLRKL
eukprot:jgi/Ulvmu1/7227/UM035_0013.1